MFNILVFRNKFSETNWVISIDLFRNKQHEYLQFIWGVYLHWFRNKLSEATEFYQLNCSETTWIVSMHVFRNTRSCFNWFVPEQVEWNSIHLIYKTLRWVIIGLFQNKFWFVSIGLFRKDLSCFNWYVPEQFLIHLFRTTRVVSISWVKLTEFYQLICSGTTWVVWFICSGQQELFQLEH